MVYISLYDVYAKICVEHRVDSLQESLELGIVVELAFSLVEAVDVSQCILDLTDQVFSPLHVKSLLLLEEDLSLERLEGGQS